MILFDFSYYDYDIHEHYTRIAVTSAIVRKELRLIGICGNLAKRLISRAIERARNGKWYDYDSETYYHKPEGRGDYRVSIKANNKELYELREYQLKVVRGELEGKTPWED